MQNIEQKKEPLFNIPGNVLCLIFFCFFLHVLRTHFLTIDQDTALILRAAFIPAHFFYFFDAWSIVSLFGHFFLHANYTHLVLNMISFAIFGTFLARRISSVRFFIFSFFIAVCSVMFYTCFHLYENTVLIGASGVISGMMGVFARFLYSFNFSSSSYEGSYASLMHSFRSYHVLSFVFLWIFSNFLIGFLGVPGIESSIAWEAHLGGFISGFLFFSFFDIKKNKHKR